MITKYKVPLSHETKAHNSCNGLLQTDHETKALQLTRLFLCFVMRKAFYAYLCLVCVVIIMRTLTYLELAWN